MDSFTDRDIASEHLKLAEKHIVEGQKRVDAQLMLLAKLERHGHNIEEAEKLLRVFEQLLALHIKHRNRIAQELKAGL
jgi:hypothetical protein